MGRLSLPQKKMVWSLTQKFVLVWALKRCHYPSLAETYAIRTIKYPWLEGWAIISRLNITILTVVTNNKRLLKVALFLSRHYAIQRAAWSRDQKDAMGGKCITTSHHVRCLQAKTCSLTVPAWFLSLSSSCSLAFLSYASASNSFC